MNEDIKSYVDEKVTKKQCEVTLNISRRTVDRLTLLYRYNGKSDFIHGNRSRVSGTKKPEQFHKDILFHH